MEIDLKTLAQAVKESGVRYDAAYNAYLQRRIDATPVEHGWKRLLVLDSEQQRAFDAWAEQQRAAA